MQELTITDLESGQRLNKYMMKYLNQAPSSFIYKMLRKKNITRNGKNVFPEELEYYLGKSTLVSESMVWASQDADGQDAVIVATIKPDMEEVEAELGKEAAQDPKKVSCGPSGGASRISQGHTSPGRR